MINEAYKAMLGGKSVIRELSEYATARGAEIGYENVFDYSLGNPSVPCPQDYTDAVIDMYKTAEPVALHGYSPSLGIPSVRKAIAESLNRRFDMDYTADYIFPTTGAAGALAHALRVVTKPGDEVITFAPYFPEYRVFIESAGAAMIETPADSSTFQIDFDRLSAAVTAHTKGVFVNSPNNPSGVVYTEENVKKLAAFLDAKSAEYGHPIYLIVDEPYRELVYGDVEVPYLTKYYKNTLVCYSYSKSLSLPGERIGYVLVPDEVDDARTIYAAVCGAGRALGFVCAPSLIQHVIAKCAGQVSDLSVYKKNRDLLYDSLTAYGFTCVHPDGAFYLFMKTPEPDAYAFCEKAKKYELLLVPGDDFGAPGFVRIAYCVTTAQIERALPAFKELAGEYFG